MEADILQLDVADVLMTITPATALPSAATALSGRGSTATKHGGTLGVCRESDDEDDDIVSDSGDDEHQPTEATALAGVTSRQRPCQGGGGGTQKSRSHKAVAAKMLTGGV